MCYTYKVTNKGYSIKGNNYFDAIKCVCNKNMMIQASQTHSTFSYCCCRLSQLHTVLKCKLCRHALVPPPCHHVLELFISGNQGSNQAKTESSDEQKFYVDHPCSFFFQSSKNLAMVVMAALINWVEMCWKVTGDTSTVVKLGQCQTLQP